jgi:hypothetical protein
MSIYHDNHLLVLQSNISNSAVIVLSQSKPFLQLRVCTPGARGGAVVEAVRYKLEGCGIDSRWRHWNFSLT